MNNLLDKIIAGSSMLSGMQNFGGQPMQPPPQQGGLPGQIMPMTQTNKPATQQPQQGQQSGQMPMDMITKILSLFGG